MPLRFIEIRAAAERAETVDEIVAEASVIDHWSLDGHEGVRIHQVLIRSETVEALTDALSARLGDQDDLRIVLLPVEATLPRVEEPKENPDDKRDGVLEDGAEDEADKEERHGWGRVSRDELLQELETAAVLSPVYLAGVALSSVVAAVGLVRGDVAAIIGAMVIAPLLGPNVALSLAATLGDLRLGRRALATSAAGAAVALLVALAVGMAVSVDPTIPELAARLQVRLSDVVLALAAGSAGALAFTSGLPTAIIGVMVAVALLPPLVATGLMVGQGLPTQALAAATLVATNVTCVNLAGVATFLMRGVAPRDWWEEKRARTTTLIALGTWVSTLIILVLLIVFAWR